MKGERFEGTCPQKLHASSLAIQNPTFRIFDASFGFLGRNPGEPEAAIF
jgi:hypothetical protein